jgi:hypothetical protein
MGTLQVVLNLKRIMIFLAALATKAPNTKGTLSVGGHNRPIALMPYAKTQSAIGTRHGFRSLLTAGSKP